MIAPLISQFGRNRLQYLIILFLLFLLRPSIFYAEGTKQASPTEDDWVLLNLREGFANYGTGGTERGISFTVLDVTEEVYFSFSGLGYSNYRNISNNSYSFRVVDGIGNVVHGPFVLDPTNFNGTNYDDVVAGPDLGTGTGYDVSDPIFNFSPTNPGIYHLEFNLDNPVNGGFGIEGIVWWDVTITDAIGVPALGRLYSKNWWFRTPTDGNPDVFAQSFEGSVFVLTTDGFVHKVDFENSGFRGLTFALAFNSSGPGISGDLNEDRKTIKGLSLALPEYDVFFNEPDPAVYSIATFGAVVLGPFLISDGQCDTTSGTFCIDYEVTKPGLIEIILDLHLQDGIYTHGTADRIIVDRIDIGEPLRGCVPWNLFDGLGNKVDPFQSFAIFIRYSQGEIHFMMNDVEYNNPGFISTVYQPAGTVAENLIFYDDSNLDLVDQDNNIDLDNNAATGTNPPLVNLNDCMMPCHIWNRLTNTDIHGYGESNTINSWWVGVSPTYSEVSTLTCQLDTLSLTKTVSKIVNSSNGIPGNYDVTFQIIFENDGTSHFNSLQLIDDMAANFGAAYINWIEGPIISAYAGTPTLPNAGTAPNLLDGISGELAPSEAIKVEFTVELNPFASGTLSILENQAIGQTTNNYSNIETDLSDDTTDPSSDDDPTEVRFPEIKVTKKVLTQPAPIAASQSAFSYDITYEYEIENNGFVDLKNIKLEDDFASNFGEGFTQVVGVPKIENATTANVPGQVNQAFVGSGGGIDLLDESGILRPGEKIFVTATVEIKLYQPDAIYNTDGYFENLVIAYGTATEISNIPKGITKAKGKFLPPTEIFDGVIVSDDSKAIYKAEICNNGIDDDGDGLEDCDDPDCNFPGSISILGDCTQLEVEDPDPIWTYQWLINGTPVLGATDYIFDPTASNGLTQFSVEVTNFGGCILTDELELNCCSPTSPMVQGGK